METNEMTKEAAVEIYKKIDGMTKQERKDYMLKMFTEYDERKQKGELYQTDDNVPGIIISSYYRYIDNPSFDNIFSNFRKKYIKNESAIEQVHEPDERKGLGKVYDYIYENKYNSNLNLYLICNLHQKLYSTVPCTNFGGQFRQEPAHIAGCSVDLSDYSNIPSQLASLFNSTNELIKRGYALQSQNNPDSLIKYIDDCIELKCKLIKIHPFKDGNGRTIRAFTNVLFKIANIPPVYIKQREKEEYRQAMEKALEDNDYSTIKTFYHYEICDSIIQLDTSVQDEMEKVSCR